MASDASGPEVKVSEAKKDDFGFSGTWGGCTSRAERTLS